VYFGFENHGTMTHLVGILDDIKQIRALKKKMENDPINKAMHEEQMWGYYTQVTQKKE
jgi:hypothetical protein